MKVPVFLLGGKLILGANGHFAEVDETACNIHHWSNPCEPSFLGKILHLSATIRQCFGFLFGRNSQFQRRKHISSFGNEFVLFSVESSKCRIYFSRCKSCESMILGRRSCDVNRLFGIQCRAYEMRNAIYIAKINNLMGIYNNASPFSTQIQLIAALHSISSD